ncbi:MAG TPA: response regulator [Thermohalobaculum sp.]|nr:response regulator [Thermohalobaculum sp.]
MADLNSMSALILEDEFIIAMDLRDMLLDWGFREVRVAHSGEEAKSMLAGGGIDLVVADFELPDGNSADLIGKAQAGGSIVVMLTGKAIDAAALEGMGRPAMLQKPVHPDALRDVVLGTLNRSRGA